MPTTLGWVTARLSSHYAASVLWQANPAAPPVAVTPLPATADAVVVGGGYCGLSAAAELARRGRRVVVVDAHDLGWGASTRNGGMVLPELKAGPRSLERSYGELGGRLHAAVEEAFDHIEALVEQEHLECDYVRCGQLYVSHSDHGASRLDALAEELTEAGSPALVVRGDDLAAEIGSTSFQAGLVVERSGGLHPARFHTGLTRIAAAAGASLHARTTATDIASSGSRFRVTTTRGTVETGDVLVATNAYADSLVPAL